MNEKQMCSTAWRLFAQDNLYGRTTLNERLIFEGGYKVAADRFKGELQYAVEVNSALLAQIPKAAVNADVEAEKYLLDKLNDINMLACYGSEEATEAQEKILLQIGEIARIAIGKATEIGNNN